MSSRKVTAKLMDLEKKYGIGMYFKPDFPKVLEGIAKQSHMERQKNITAKKNDAVYKAKERRTKSVESGKTSIGTMQSHKIDSFDKAKAHVKELLANSLASD